MAKIKHKENNNDDDDLQSKSAIKREIIALRETSEFILGLKKNKRDKLALDPTLLSAIDEYMRLSKKDAQRRHVQYFTRRLYETENLEEVLEAVDLLKQPHIQQKKSNSRLETLLDLILKNDNNAIQSIYDEHRNIERQTFQQLIRNAIKEKESNNTLAQDDFNSQTNKQDKHLKKLKKFLKGILAS